MLLAVALAISVWGDSTTLAISNGSDTVTGPTSSTLNFPIARGGDASYQAFLQFQTQDGTAIAGTDYSAAIGSQVFPAGASTSAIPVAIAGSNTNQSDKTFQMLLLGGGGAGMGFTPSFTAQQTFAVGTMPRFVTVADINGDGKPDLIVPNGGDATVSVLLNITAPGANTPSFAGQQTFATGIDPRAVTA
ncbi:MAG TPA: Calx-beta domain-containing protein, partial [Steroidobacteraceae bacterium]|nr:Calx-beta domain-containing protein [Steroidobacteraceae bacterium]